MGPRRGGTESVELLLQDLAKWPTPTLDEQVELSRRVVDGDRDAVQEMALANMRLVVHWARHHQTSGLDLGDLVQEGTFGLFNAIEKFDHRRGIRFSTYASWWIRQAMRRAITNGAKTIRVPDYQATRARQISSATDDLRGEHGRDPNETEIGAATGLTVAQQRSAREVARVVCSLDAPIRDDDGATLGDTVADASRDPASSVAEGASDEADAWMALLDEHERQILRLRFGLDGEPMTLSEVGALVGMTSRKLRQVELRAILKLRASAGGSCRPGDGSSSD